MLPCRSVPKLNAGGANLKKIQNVLDIFVTCKRRIRRGFILCGTRENAV